MIAEGMLHGPANIRLSRRGADNKFGHMHRNISNCDCDSNTPGRTGNLPESCDGRQTHSSRTLMQSQARFGLRLDTP